jgi:hypothetical protein
VPLINDPIDLLLDQNNDLVIENGDLKFSRGIEAIVQQCRINLQIFQEEWFLNLDIGIPYWQNILGYKPAVAIAAARIFFTRELLVVDGVDGVTRLDINYTGTTRTLNLDWQVSTVFGDTPNDTINLRVLTGSE